MYSLVMSPFSRDFIKMEIACIINVSTVDLRTCVRYLHSAWFLDGRTSILVTGENIDKFHRLQAIYQYFTFQNSLLQLFVCKDNPIHQLSKC